MKTILNFLLLAVLLAGCTAKSKEDSAGRSAPSTVQQLPVVRLKEQTTDLQREYVGQINANRNVEIYARVKGYLEQIYVDEGESVKKGQTLFRINDEEYKVEAAKARAMHQSAIAEAKAAELEVSRLKLLVDKKIISNIEWEVAEANLLAARAKIEQANAAQTNANIHMARTRIRAPFSGAINRIPYKPGSLIDEGTQLTTLSDTRTVYVYFKVSENEYLEFIKAQRDNIGGNGGVVRLELADGSLFPEKGQIQTMEGEFDTSTGSIAFRAQFPNPKGLLKHGSSGNVLLTNTVSDAILVPQKAVFEIQDKSYVYVMDSTNQVSMRSFVPKSRFQDYYVVRSGLEAGDQIVYEGIQALKDGVKIKPKIIDMAVKPAQEVKGDL